MGQGDYKEDEFSPEELAALGEASPKEDPDNPPEPKEPPEEEPPKDDLPTDEPPAEPKAEPAAQPPESAPEGTPDKLDPVQKRIDRLTWEKNEQERKLTLLKKLGADEFYRIHPEERPADYQPPQPKQEAAAVKEPDYREMAAMVVRGGPYDGRTLGDLLESADPADRVAAIDLMTEHKAAVREQAQKTEQVKREYQEQTTREQNAFEYNLAKETFGKAEGFTSEEVQKIKAVSSEVIAWMLTPDPVTGRKRSGYSFADAYFVMNRAGLINAAAQKAAKDALEKITAPGTKSIGSGDSGAQLTGYEAMLAMSEKQLEAKIDAMPDKEARKFYKEAPKALREKHPSLPWD